MNGAFEIAAIGLGSQQQALDVIANNITNVNTPGFKRSDVRFSEIIAERNDPANPAANLTSGPSLAGVTAEAVLALSEQGDLERTGQALDLAIEGAGFIELMGPAGQTLLWRGGRLVVGEDGLLAAADGFPLRAAITVPADATDLQNDPNGLVKAQIAGSEEELGQIMLVRLDDAAAVERLDGGYYALLESRALQEQTPGQDGAGEFVQGAIEHSNVELNNEMVRLMLVQRSYAADAQVLQAADQMMAIANNLRK